MASSSFTDTSVWENALAALHEKLDSVKLLFKTKTISETENENKQTTIMDTALAKLQEETDKHRELDDLLLNLSPIKAKMPSEEEMNDVNNRTVIVDSLDDATTSAELEAHFEQCGPIERININANTITGEFNGFAYIQFIDVEGMQNALALDKTWLLGQMITVEPKRHNVPGFGKSPRFQTQYRSEKKKSRKPFYRTPY